MKLTSSASFSPSIRISLRLKIHQAQAKNFCRVLDIRVAKIVETNLRQARSIQHPMEHMEHAVWCDRPAGGAGKYIAAAGMLLPLLLQNAYRIRSKRDGAVGILGFQRSLPHLSIDAPHLTAHSQRLG